MCSGIKSIIFDYRISHVTLLAWERQNRKEYYVRDIPCNSVLKLNQYLQNTQEHSVVIFVRNTHDEITENKWPNLDDISRIEVEEEEEKLLKDEDVELENIEAVVDMDVLEKTQRL